MILEIAAGRWRLTATETNHRQPSALRYVRSAIELRFTKKLDFERGAFVEALSFHSPIVRRDVMDGDER